MERFVKQLSLSIYREKLMLKGVILVSVIVGIDNRSTMDIDATVKDFPLSFNDESPSSTKNNSHQYQENNLLHKLSSRCLLELSVWPIHMWSFLLLLGLSLQQASPGRCFFRAIPAPKHNPGKPRLPLRQCRMTAATTGYSLSDIHCQTGRSRYCFGRRVRNRY